MEHDERDILAILEFDLAEETIGIWLRRIMQCLEEKRDVGKGLPRLFVDGRPGEQGGCANPTRRRYRHRTGEDDPSGHLGRPRFARSRTLGYRTEKRTRCAPETRRRWLATVSQAAISI